METQYNQRSPAVKRLMREAQEMSTATKDYFAQPLEDNLFEWHFTVRGPSDTDFQGGIYHGRIILPTDYPMKPPNIIVLTPNGRFEVGKKICLSISGHHPESWQPSWSIRTALLAIIGFMPTPGEGTIGSLNYSSEERRKLALSSVHFKCDQCGNPSLLLRASSESQEDQEEERRQNAATQLEAQEIAKSMSFSSPTEETPPQTNNQSEANSPPKSAQSREIEERKKASKAAQERFRQKLLARTKGLSGLDLKSVSPGPNRAHQPNIPPPGLDPIGQPLRGPARNHNQEGPGLHSLYDFLIIILVVAISALLYRRLHGFQTDEQVLP